jgi:hypothetical protein
LITLGHRTTENINWIRKKSKSRNYISSSIIAIQEFRTCGCGSVSLINISKMITISVLLLYTVFRL